MDRTGNPEKEEICKVCPYARFDILTGYIECDPPMGECRLEFDAQKTDDYSKPEN